MSAEKFKKDGLWGLRLPSGDIVMEPKYDKLELCTDFIYAHYGDCHKFFYKNGFVSECADKDDDYRFYENGAVGINNSDGSVFLPADYDVATSISKVVSEDKVVKEGIYTLTGVKVKDTNSTENLPSGIYIINGKKQVIR